jgi:hypothetical protein
MEQEATVLGDTSTFASQVKVPTPAEAEAHLSAALDLPPSARLMTLDRGPTAEDQADAAKKRVVMNLATQVVAHARDVVSAVSAGVHTLAVDAHVAALHTAMDQLTAAHEDVVVSHIAESVHAAADEHVPEPGPGLTPHDQVSTVHAEAARDAAASVVHAIDSNAPHEVIAAHVSALASAAMDLHDHVLPSHEPTIQFTAKASSTTDKWIALAGLLMLAVAGAVAYFHRT